MHLKRLAYLLVLVLTSAQLDDAWAVAPDLPSAPLTDDNDECLPARRQLRAEPPSRHEPVFAGLHSRTAACPLVRRGLRSESNPATPVTPQPLYAFLSLQI